MPRPITTPKSSRPVVVGKVYDPAITRRAGYQAWYSGCASLGMHLCAVADLEESSEPRAHQPAGTISITELLKYERH